MVLALIHNAEPTPLSFFESRAAWFKYELICLIGKRNDRNETNMSKKVKTREVPNPCWIRVMVTQKTSREELWLAVRGIDDDTDFFSKPITRMLLNEQNILYRTFKPE